MTNKRNDGNTSAKDEARTPPVIFGKLNAEFHFTVDIAATGKNTLCGNFWGKTESFPLGFLSPHAELYTDDKAWCNPPYSNGNILKFVHKAYLESGKGATVVMLIPSDPSTQYFNICFGNASEIRFMQPRVRFNNPDGTPMKGSPQTGSMIVVFRPGEHKETKSSIWKWKQ
jgi:site-specific DNA-methyltransferase (adenine-specific)